jgi:hypothetical protein
MRSLLAAVTGVVVGGLVAGVVLLADERQVSTEAIDSDIASAKRSIAEAEADASQYSGGLILAQIKLRRSMYETTVAMLQQKRESLIHRISMSYNSAAAGGSLFSTNQPPDEDIRNARAEIARAADEAKLYSGGLVLSLIIARKAQYELTLATLNHALLANKYGVPLSVPQSASPPPEARSAPPVRDPAKDQGAL